MVFLGKYNVLFFSMINIDKKHCMIHPNCISLDTCVKEILPVLAGRTSTSADRFQF